MLSRFFIILFALFCSFTPRPIFSEFLGKESKARQTLDAGWEWGLRAYNAAPNLFGESDSDKAKEKEADERIKEEARQKEEATKEELRIRAEAKQKEEARKEEIRIKEEKRRTDEAAAKAKAEADTKAETERKLDEKKKNEEKISASTAQRNELNISEESPIPASASKPSLGECMKLGTKAITDWLNSINLGSFSDSGSKYIRHHHECFVYINPLGTLGLWIEPYGYRVHYYSPLKHHQKMDFELTSTGAEIGAEGMITGDIRVRGGVGYFHSNFECKRGRNTSTINGVYVAPSIEYQFTDGSIGLTLFGIGNFYEGKRTICTSKKRTSDVKYHSQSWDMNVRLESEYTLEPPSDFFIRDFFFHPFIRVDYLNVFEPSHRVKVSKESSVSFEGHHSSYFYSKLGTRFEKIMICNHSGILTASVDLGWINMSPLTSSLMKWKVSGEGKGDSFDGRPESKNQLALGAGIKGLYASGLLVGLDYSAAVGANSPMQTIKMRLEWNW